MRLILGLDKRYGTRKCTELKDTEFRVFYHARLGRGDGLILGPEGSCDALLFAAGSGLPASAHIHPGAGCTREAPSRERTQGVAVPDAP